jgi:hypothetical protein
MNRAHLLKNRMVVELKIEHLRYKDLLDRILPIYLVHDGFWSEKISVVPRTKCKLAAFRLSDRSREILEYALSNRECTKKDLLNAALDYFADKENLIRLWTL